VRLPMRGRGVGFEAKTRNRALMARFRVYHVKRWCGVALGGSGCMLMAWRWQGGCAFADVKPGGGMWAKNPKPSMCGLVSGTLCKRGVGWCLDVVGARLLHGGGLRVCQREAKGQDLSQKPETKHVWLGFGHAV
jgi:hypothetical protein